MKRPDGGTRLDGLVRLEGPGTLEDAEVAFREYMDGLEAAGGGKLVIVLIRKVEGLT